MSTFCQQGAGFNFSQKKESRGTAKLQEASSQKVTRIEKLLTFAFSRILEMDKLEI